MAEFLTLFVLIVVVLFILIGMILVGHTRRLDELEARLRGRDAGKGGDDDWHTDADWWKKDN